MISADVDMKELASSLGWVAAQFGECNETGIARWGVATDRMLVKETQVWGDGKQAKTTHENAMIRDAKRVAIVIQDPKLTRRVMKKSLTGFFAKGKKWTFTPQQNLTTAKGLNDWIDLNRSKKSGRPPKAGLKNGVMCITTGKVVMSAMRDRFKRIGKAKGGWIGAGQAIGAHQKTGSRITIGKNVAGYAHKWKSGGTASMKRDTWSPEGTMVNHVKHSADPHVLRPGQMDKAVKDAGRNTITWYEKTLNGRLNRKR
jgi:hypothetical protein